MLEVWGDRHSPCSPVYRVEFEIGRQGLAEFGLDRTEEVLNAIGDLWAYCTEPWLTYRSPTADANRSRWPVAPEWNQVQGANLRQQTVGLQRLHAGRHAGSLRKLMPSLAGYLVGFAALVGTHDIEDTLTAVGHHLHDDEVRRGVTFAERVRGRRLETAFR